MKKFYFSISLFIFSIAGATAQNNTDAERIIDNLIASMKAKAVTTNFQLSVTERNAVTLPSLSGSYVMKGSKFTIVMDESKVWFDGKTQWNYSKSDNEVSVTEPTTDELAQVNPMAILSAFKSKSWIRYAKSKQANSELIELIPKDKKDDYTKAEVQVNKNTKIPEFIRLTDKKKTVSVLKLTNYKTIGNIKDATFVFDKANYKKITINDLR